jgi:hypothetical protein
MDHALPSRSRPRGFAAIAVALLALALLLAWSGEPASAKPLLVKNGRIHACYKAKGKTKGTVRLVRSAKVRCPRGWKKVAWSAGGQAGAPGDPGFPGDNGSAGETGQGGTKGEGGAQGTAAKVSSLESQVTELLTKLKSLESVLAGLNNQQLKEAVAAVPVVSALCGQTKALNEQTTALVGSTGALNTLLDTLIIPFVPVAVPAALPAFSCP